MADSKNVVVDAKSLIAVMQTAKGGTGVGDFARELLVGGLMTSKQWMRSSDVVAAVKAKFPDCKISEKSVAWYKNELRYDEAKVQKYIDRIQDTSK